MSVDFRLIVPLAALVFGSVVLGGGVYETLLVDRVWPWNPALIQPMRGGLNRRVFWSIAHPFYELALIAGTWLNWPCPAVRPWLIAALALHIGARVWAFAYFIPRALRFEKLGDLTQSQRKAALRWVHLSRTRTIIAIASIVLVAVAVVMEAGQPLGIADPVTRSSLPATFAALPERK